jgi:hypothetical protein
VSKRTVPDDRGADVSSLPLVAVLVENFDHVLDIQWELLAFFLVDLGVVAALMLGLLLYELLGS